MGWLFSPRFANKADLRHHLTEANGLKTIKSCWKGNNLWAVHEYTYSLGHPETPGKTIQFVGLYLCKFYKDEGGYKDMDESAGPYYHNCPISYIEMVEAHEREHGYGPTGHAADWRARVREHYAKATQTLAEGQKIKLYGQEYTVGAKHWKGGYRIWQYTTDYHLPKRMLKDVEVLV